MSGGGRSRLGRLGIFAGMKKLFFIGVCLWAFGSTQVMAQTGGTDVVVVRIAEPSALGGTRLIIIYPDGKSEEGELPSAGLSSKKLTESGQAYQRTFAKLYQQGYAIKSTFSGLDGSASTLFS